MFRLLEANTVLTITFTIDNETITANEGMNIAAALLASGHRALRETAVSGATRGPFCMMGTCFDCLVQIDGETVQACMVQVEQGLQVSRVPVADNEIEARK